MSPKVHRRLYALITNPPRGSKIAAAKEFGIDLTLNLRSLMSTPEERATNMEKALDLMQALQQAGAKRRKSRK
jgi:hypothetical protein